MKNLLFLRLNHRKKNLFGGKNGTAGTVPDYNKDMLLLLMTRKRGEKLWQCFPAHPIFMLVKWRVAGWRDLEVLLALHGESRVWKGKKV